LYCAPHLLNGARDDAALLAGAAAEHGVRLAGTRLAIGKEAHLVAVQRGLHQLTHLREHVRLRRLRVEHAVVRERVRRAALGVVQPHRGGVRHAERRRSRLARARWHRTHTAEDAHVAAKLLCD
jgi:hypothetical protein